MSQMPTVNQEIIKESPETKKSDPVRGPDKSGDKYLYPDTPLPLYYQFPVFLLEMPVSQTARIIYMILYGRARLSIKNHWIDAYGRIYIYYPVKELAEKTGKGITAVKTAMSELAKIGLLEKQTAGFGKPSRIFTLLPSDFRPSEGRKSSPGAVGKPAPNKVIKNKKIQNHQSEYSGYSVPVWSGKRNGPFEDYEHEEEETLF